MNVPKAYPNFPKQCTLKCFDSFDLNPSYDPEKLHQTCVKCIEPSGTRAQIH